MKSLVIHVSCGKTVLRPLFVSLGLGACTPFVDLFEELAMSEFGLVVEGDGLLLFESKPKLFA